jgi:hypothetical protein
VAISTYESPAPNGSSVRSVVEQGATVLQYCRRPKGGERDQTREVTGDLRQVEIVRNGTTSLAVVSDS